MLDSEYLVKGLIGLSRVGGELHWAEGHYGAAMITAYLFCKENGLPEETRAVIQEQADLLIHAYSEYFRPYTGDDLKPVKLLPILEAIEDNIAYLCGIGHNTIFTALALRALHEQPILCTQGVVQGVARLIRSFPKGSDNNRTNNILGIDMTQISVGDDPSIPEYTDDRQIALFTFEEFLKFKRIYREGALTHAGHLVTHAQALTELSRLGYGDLARKGYEAHRLQVAITRHFYDLQRDDLTLLSRSEKDWMTPDYWNQDLTENNWASGHYFKYCYHFYDLLKRVDDVDLKAAVVRQMGYLMERFSS